MVRIYYKLDTAIDKQHQKSVIISQEIKKKAKSVYKFLVFDNINEYIDNYSIYPNTHECICKDMFGEYRKARLIFDFDITENLRKDIQSKHITSCDDFVHKTFISDMESCIVKTLEVFNLKIKGLNNLDITQIEFIWTKSNSTKKLSYHLYMKNVVLLEFPFSIKTVYNVLSEICKNNDKMTILKNFEFIDDAITTLAANRSIKNIINFLFKFNYKLAN